MLHLSHSLLTGKEKENKVWGDDVSDPQHAHVSACAHTHTCPDPSCLPNPSISETSNLYHSLLTTKCWVRENVSCFFKKKRGGQNHQIWRRSKSFPRSVMTRSTEALRSLDGAWRSSFPMMETGATGSRVVSSSPEITLSPTLHDTPTPTNLRKSTRQTILTTMFPGGPDKY